MNKKYDVTGREFGYLTVLGRDETSVGQRNSKWFCKCKCGNITSVTRSCLVSGKTTSCGCKHFETHNATHGMSKTKIYRTWNNMKNRCYNHNVNCFDDYGGRGITVCNEWKESFLSFYEWATENGYSDDLTLDRIDVNDIYKPENCRWVSMSDQQRNKTSNIFVQYEGETWCLKTLCNHIGFPYKTAHVRYTKAKRKGKQIDTEKLFAPIQTNKIAYKYRKSN